MGEYQPADLGALRDLTRLSTGEVKVGWIVFAVDERCLSEEQVGAIGEFRQGISWPGVS